MNVDTPARPTSRRRAGAAAALSTGPLIATVVVEWLVRSLVGEPPFFLPGIGFAGLAPALLFGICLVPCVLWGRTLGHAVTAASAGFLGFLALPGLLALLDVGARGDELIEWVPAVGVLSFTYSLRAWCAMACAGVFLVLARGLREPQAR